MELSEVTNLFIIGNGFDSAHGLKTTYEHFRKYLLSEYPEINPDELVVPEAIPQYGGGIDYRRSEIFSLLLFLINDAESNTEYWKDVEAALGRLNFNEALDWLEPHLDKEGDVDISKTSYLYEDTVSTLIKPTLKIKELFPEWINTINLNHATPKETFQQLIDSMDFFLSFNYTETLEQVYDVPESQVCHIHGTQNSEIFFGHGSDEDRTEEYMQRHYGSQDGLFEIENALRKRTDIALQNNEAFFVSLTNANIEKIYSFGFSFSQVDRIYLWEICSRINTDKVTWYFNDYDIHNHEEYKEILKTCGFNGSFSTFHIK